MGVLIALAIVSAVATGLVGGVFFAFSVFVMRALADLPPTQGVAAMQRINVTVINPLFLGVFLGTVPLLAGTAFVARAALCPQAFIWLATAFVVYLLGTVGVTLACNVPRNNRLAELQSGSTEAADYWPAYVREWGLWNHVRCIASLVSAAAAIYALVVCDVGLAAAA